MAGHWKDLLSAIVTQTGKIQMFKTLLLRKEGFKIKVKIQKKQLMQCLLKKLDTIIFYITL